MTTTEIVAIIALLISFCGLVVALRREGRDSGKARDTETSTLTTIQNKLDNIVGDLGRFERKVDKIDDRSEADHEKIIENDTKIKNLEKEVFKRSERSA